MENWLFYEKESLAKEANLQKEKEILTSTDILLSRSKAVVMVLGLGGQVVHSQKILGEQNLLFAEFLLNTPKLIPL